MFSNKSPFFLASFSVLLYGCAKSTSLSDSSIAGYISNGCSLSHRLGIVATSQRYSDYVQDSRNFLELKLSSSAQPDKSSQFVRSFPEKCKTLTADTAFLRYKVEASGDNADDNKISDYKKYASFAAGQIASLCSLHNSRLAPKSLVEASADILSDSARERLSSSEFVYFDKLIMASKKCE